MFWKFFLAVWLAQVATFLGAGAVFWFTHTTEGRIDPMAERHIARQIDEVARTLTSATEPARVALERRWPRGEALAEVYVVDAQGQDLFGRMVPPTQYAWAREQAHDARFGFDPHGFVPDPAGPGASAPTLPAQERFGPGDAPPGELEPLRVHMPDGAQYLVFATQARGDKPPRRDGGPFPLVPFGVAIVASLVFGAFLAWYFAAPIRVLRGAFDEASRGNLNQRVGPSIGSRRDELADLGRHYDRMAAQLAALMDGQRRLLHDVSHELRSPLARLHAAIGLARQQPDNVDASFERIEREADRMNDLVGELLTLSRLEAGVQGAPAESVDAAELTAAVVDDARFEASTQGRTVEFNADGEAPVFGQPELLHRAIENIVRNALVHTPVDTAVEVSVTRDAEQVRIAVRDAGPGVPPGRLADIFEPFVRMPGAKRDGHGLGLAIARRVIERMGGLIQARNRSEGGLAVEIILPIAERAPVTP